MKRTLSRLIKGWKGKLLFSLILVALLADLLSNEKPLIAACEGGIFFPALGIGQKNCRVILPALIPYSPDNMDLENARSVGPFSSQVVPSLHYRHWLGTDELGRDVLSGLIHGTRSALVIGFLSMLLAGCIGIIMGSLAGYFGDHRLELTRASWILLFLFVVPALFYSSVIPGFILENLGVSEGIRIFLYMLFWLLTMALQLWIAFFIAGKVAIIEWARRKWKVPVDLIVMRIIEVVGSVPVLFLVLGVAALAKPSSGLVILLVGFTFWITIAKYTRAEMLKIRTLPYIEGASALGLPWWKILWNHALPNAMPPVRVALAFGVGQAILVESTLSFLGVGLPQGEVTWGALLASARSTPSAWWLALFPGLAIFITILLFHRIGDELEK